MKKIINNPEDFVDEFIDGILKAYPHHLRKVGDNNRSLVRAESPIEGKVGIATGGGSGHLPLFLGYVGEGLADGVSVGDVFSSPSPGEMSAVTRNVDSGKGVLYLYGNYSGDVMNFDMAADMTEDVRVETTVVTDDVASAPAGEEGNRRGIAGLFYVYKMAGAKAEMGASLEEVKRVADKAVDNTRSMGVALSPCQIPEAGEPTFSIADDKMEIGMGIHGEQGIERTELKKSDEITEIIMEKILDDLPFEAGDRVSVLINSLGGTPLEELFVMYRKVSEILGDNGIDIYKPFVGEYATSMEMKGASISVIGLDQELTDLLDEPYHSPFLPKQPK